MHKLKWLAPAAATIVLVLLVAGCTRRPRPTPTLPLPLATIIAQVTIISTEVPINTPEPATPAPPSGTVSPSGSGLPSVGAGPEPTPPPQIYIVAGGDTLSSIAARFRTSLDSLMEANGISDPNRLSVGQKLKIPSTEVSAGPDLLLLPDSEFVNGPAYVDFDVTAFAAAQGGYLAAYSENVGGQLLSGPEIVERVVQEYSVGPRMLLAVLESKSGWVTDPSPSGQELARPMGYKGGGSELLQWQLSWAANELNRGYYNWRGRGVGFLTWGDSTATRFAPGLNAATAGLQHFFSLNNGKAKWQQYVGDGPGSFDAAYRRLFGDAGRYAIEPLIPADTPLPSLALPFAENELWFYTSGPHGGWGEGSAWAAIDVVPAEGYLGCQMAASWATASASGLVIESRSGVVKIDLDSDGREETGWVLLYLHVAKAGRVSADTTVAQGDPVGHPSCEGGLSQATHLHFARKFNGEWIAADGPLPLVLSGWRFYSDGVSYDGTASRGDQERTACECHEPDFNGLVAD